MLQMSASDVQKLHKSNVWDWEQYDLLGINHTNTELWVYPLSDSHCNPAII